MAKKIAFSLELEGSQKLLTNLTNVELGLSDIGKKLRETRKDLDTFKNGTDEQRDALIKAGKSVESLTDDYKKLKGQQLDLREDQKKLNKELRDQVKEFKEVENATPDDSLIGLRRQYANLRKEINLMDTAARNSAEGLEKIAKAQGIKKQIDEIGDSVDDFRSRVGGYEQAIKRVIDSLGGKGLSSIFGGGGGNGPTTGGGLGPVVNPLAGITGPNPLDALGLGGISEATSALGPYGAAVGSAIGVTVALGGYIVSIDEQFAQLNNTVANSTGLFGQELADATVGVKTLSEVFNKDFNEVLQAANTLTKEVTGDFNKSVDLIKTGLLAGADANGEFLDSIGEYSSQIREAGASGEEFIEILVRAQREGIYSDKGIDVVKEFGLRIREQTDSTKDALESAFGEKFTKDLFDNINNGSTNSVEALASVSKELQKNQLTAKQSQTLIADVFGGPGEDAGRRFIEILGEVDGNLDDLVDSVDAYTQRQIGLYDATLELNTQQQILAGQFATTGFSMDTLVAKAKGLGTAFLNEIILTGRAIKKEFEDGNILTGLNSILNPGSAIQANLRNREELLKADVDALREIKEGEKAAAEERRKNALEGKVSLQVLQQEQKKLREEIDAARVAGEDYTESLDNYNTVTLRISEATKILNGNIEKTKKKFKEVAADGSIDQLSEKVSKLQERIDKSTPNQALKLIDDLNEAELDLGRAEKELEDFKEAVRLANVESLAIEDQVAIYKEGIEAKRQLEIASAKSRIESEILLVEELKKINLQSDIDVLNQELRQFKEGSADFLSIINQIANKKEQIGDIEIGLKLIEENRIIEESELILSTIFTNTIENEQELQERLKAVQQSAQIERIKTRLANEELTNAERLKLELDLQNKISELQKTQASITAEFIRKSNDIDNAQENSLSSIIPTFDPTDTEKSLEQIKLFNEARKVLELQSAIERLELRKELLKEEGEDIIGIENEIALKRLELDQLTNAKLIASQKKRIEQQKQQEKEYLKVTTDVIEGAGEIFKGVMDGTIETAEDAQQAFLGLLLEAAEKVILLQIAQASAQSFAQPDSVATFGATGAARAAILTGLIKAAFSVAKSAILSEDGNILKFANGGSLKNGSLFTGASHKNGGEKFVLRRGNKYQLNEAEGGEAIIKKTSTQKWLGLLSAINEDTGGKKLSSDSGYWKMILERLRGGQIFQQGGTIGSASRIPQLTNPSKILAIESTIKASDMTMLADMVADRYSETSQQVLSNIVDRMITGLDESNKLKERFESAIQNSQL